MSQIPAVRPGPICVWIDPALFKFSALPGVHTMPVFPSKARDGHRSPLSISDFVGVRLPRPWRSVTSKPSRPRFRPAIDLLESRTMLSTFTVTNTQDSGTGSLRDAIAQANAHSGADKINFASQVAGTILLTSGPLTITDDVKINGPGAGQLAISGGGVSRVFVIDGGSFGGAGKVTIKDLTITQGLATEDATFPASGGGILDLEADLNPQGRRPDREPGAIGRRRRDDLPRVADCIRFDMVE